MSAYRRSSYLSSVNYENSLPRQSYTGSANKYSSPIRKSSRTGGYDTGSSHAFSPNTSRYTTSNDSYQSSKHYGTDYSTGGYQRRSNLTQGGSPLSYSPSVTTSYRTDKYLRCSNRSYDTCSSPRNIHDSCLNNLSNSTPGSSRDSSIATHVDQLDSFRQKLKGFTSAEDLQDLLKETEKTEERQLLRAAIRKVREQKEAEKETTNSMTSCRSYRSERSTTYSPNNKEAEEERDYSLIQNEEELKRLLDSADNYFEKKKIRAAMRELRKQKEENTSASSSTSTDSYQSRYRTSREKDAEAVLETNTEKKESDVKSVGDMSLLEKLTSDMENCRQELEETKDFDKRREIRSAMRALRSQIREGKMKPNSRDSLSQDKTAAPDSEMSEQSNLGTKVVESSDTGKPAERPDSLDIIVTEEDDGTVVVENTQTIDDTTCTVKMRSKHSRTTSQSEVYERATTLTKEMVSPGGTKFVEQDDIVTKTKKSVRGSMFSETDMTMKKLVRTKSGSEYAETDVLIETDSSSVTTGEKTSNSVEMKVTFDKLSDTSLTSIEEDKELDLSKNGNTIAESNNNQPKVLSAVEESSGYGSSENVKDEVFDSTSTSIPEIVVPLPDKTVFDGDTVVLECKVSGAGNESEIIWQHGSEVIKPTKDFQQTFNGETAKLVICEVLFPDDDGIYKCIVKTSEGEAETTAKITVKANPNLKAPAFAPLLTDVTVQDGDKVKFEAKVEGQPKPIIKWYKNSKCLNNSVDYKQTFNGAIATLEIDEVFPEDSGEYWCTATNEAGDAKTICQLTVKAVDTKSKDEKPKITSELASQDIKDGAKVVLKCGVTGSPEPKIFWYKDDKLIKSSGDINVEYDGVTATLTITEAFPEDAGTYECVAENSTGEVSCEANLKVIVPEKIEAMAPEFTQLLASFEVQERERAVFECSVTGQPEPKVVWYHNSKVIEPIENIKISFVENAVKLEVVDVLPEDSGEYECSAENSAGMAKCSCTLTVKALKPEASTAKTEPETVDGSTSHPLAESQKSPDSKVTAVDMATLNNLDSIHDEEALQKLLNETNDFDDRKKVRGRIREVREVKRQERENDRKRREQAQQDEVKRKHEQAQEEKQYRMKRFEEMAKDRNIGKGSSLVEEHIRQKQKDAEEKKQKVLKEFEVKAATDSIGKVGHAAEDAIQIKIQLADDLKREKLEAYSHVSRADDSKNDTKTNVTTSTQKGKDGSTTFTKTTKTITTSQFGGTSYGRPGGINADQTAESIVQKLSSNGNTSSGTVSIKQQSWSSTSGLKKTETTKTWGGKSGQSGAIASLGAAPKKAPTGARGAMAAFKQMDKTANPNAAGSKPNFLSPSGGGGRATGGVARSASQIKEMLLKWIQAMTREYDIEITNFSTSWNDGMAFCALIHHFYPDAFDYKALDPKNREHNFTLAFDVAEKHADIAPLLDVEDMVRYKKPDWKCVFTYVQSFYRKLRNHESNNHQSTIEQ